jgi:hypothetical protein
MKPQSNTDLKFLNDEKVPIATTATRSADKGAGILQGVHQRCQTLFKARLTKVSFKPQVFTLFSLQGPPFTWSFSTHNGKFRARVVVGCVEKEFEHEEWAKSKKVVVFCLFL